MAKRSSYPARPVTSPGGGSCRCTEELHGAPGGERPHGGVACGRRWQQFGVEVLLGLFDRPAPLITFLSWDVRGKANNAEEDEEGRER